MRPDAERFDSTRAVIRTLMDKRTMLIFGILGALAQTPGSTSARADVTTRPKREATRAIALGLLLAACALASEARAWGAMLAPSAVAVENRCPALAPG